MTYKASGCFTKYDMTGDFKNVCSCVFFVVWKGLIIMHNSCL